MCQLLNRLQFCYFSRGDDPQMDAMRKGTGSSPELETQGPPSNGLFPVPDQLSDSEIAAIDAGIVDGVSSQDQSGFEEAAAQQIAVDTAEIHEQSYAGLLPLLQRLDERLAAAVEAAERLFAARAAGDLYRGLAITPADVVAALSRVPGKPFLSLSIQAHEIAEATSSLSLQRLLWLKRVYGLTDLDLGIILVSLAPEIDLRYERLYAYLHDDVTKRRPSIDLALNILCASAGEKLQQRERFASDAPLVRHRLIEVFADPHHLNPPLLAHFIRLDEQVVRFLLLDDSLDSRLTSFSELTAPLPSEESAPLAEDLQQQLNALAASEESLLRLYFHGPAHCGQAEAAGLLAETQHRRILNADLQRLSTTLATTSADVLMVLVREAWFRGALLYLRGLDATKESAPPNYLDTLWRALKELPVHCVIEGSEGWIPASEKPLGVATLSFAYPDVTQRRQWWQRCLQRNEFEIEADTLATLAQRYRMTYHQIEDAAAVAASSAKAALLKAANSGSEDFALAQTLFAASRGECGHDLAKLAKKIEPRATWDDLVLPDDTIAQLRELCDRYNYRDKVLNEWGFARKLSYGLGINALFSGGSGTGKTMAAEVIANALGLDIYRIDLAQVVSKYIGETEKNLDRVFTAAANANTILFFDEADALFGKRSEVKDAHDRYANLEISYLLQMFEQYEGIAILATNLSDNLDQAFARRLAFSIHFPFPDEAARLRIWERAWPTAATLEKSLDFNALAQGLRISGASIKSIALRASFLAAASLARVNACHVLASIRREGRSESFNAIPLEEVLGQDKIPMDNGPFLMYRREP